MPIFSALLTYKEKVTCIGLYLLCRLIFNMLRLCLISCPGMSLFFPVQESNTIYLHAVSDWRMANGSVCLDSFKNICLWRIAFLLAAWRDGGGCSTMERYVFIEPGVRKKVRKNLNIKQKRKKQPPNPAVSMVSGFQGFGWTPVLCAC